jgi:general secretion pathway protein D
VVTTTQNSPIADALQQAAASEVLGATGGLFGLGLRAGNAIFGAILNAVQSDSASNLLATPSVVTLDNQEAHFLAGQEVPVTTGEALSDNFDNAFRTVQRQNIGISLDVTPQIGAGDTIKLDIRQEVSSIAGTVGGRNSADLIFNKREIHNSFVVDDGEIMAIGGLLNDNERKTLEKIPFLGDLPVVGNLFKSRGRQREKTNLMVFIRPTILRTAADARAVTERRYGYVRSQQYQQDPYREPTIDELVREYMGMAPPPPPPPVPVPLDPMALVPVEQRGKEAPPLNPALYLPAVQPGDQVISPGTVTEPPR